MTVRKPLRAKSSASSYRVTVPICSGSWDEGKWGYAYLVVVEWDTEDIGKEKDDLVLRVLAGGGGDVGFDPADLLDLACMWTAD